MNRTFRARIGMAQCLFLALNTAVVVWALWEKRAVIGAFLILLLIVLIERLLNTAYTLTADGRLVVCKGRFSPVRVIAAGRITHVSAVARWRLGRWEAMRHVVVCHGEGSVELLTPANETDFLQALHRWLERNGKEQ